MDNPQNPLEDYIVTGEMLNSEFDFGGRLTRENRRGEYYAKDAHLRMYSKSTVYFPSGEREKDFSTVIQGDVVDRLAQYENVSEYLDGVSAQRMHQIFKAEWDGRLVILPVKQGDTVYSIEHPMGRNRKIIVQRQAETTVEIYNWLYLGLWGNTVFATREEAEKALRKIYEGGD